MEALNNNAPKTLDPVLARFVETSPMRLSVPFKAPIHVEVNQSSFSRQKDLKVINETWIVFYERIQLFNLRFDCVCNGLQIRASCIVDIEQIFQLIDATQESLLLTTKHETFILLNNFDRLHNEFVAIEPRACSLPFISTRTVFTGPFQECVIHLCKREGK